RRCEIPAADHERRCLMVPPNPPLNRRAARTAAVLLRDARGFRRQRPALAEIPRRIAKSIPIHDVGTNAADELVVLERPPVARHLRIAAIDECKVGPERVGDEPDRTASTAVPVLHELEPLVLWR